MCVLTRHLLSPYIAKCRPRFVVLVLITSLCCCCRGDVVWMCLQLAMKFLEKDELSNYTFQNDFMRPFVVVMRQSQVGCRVQ